MLSNAVNVSNFPIEAPIPISIYGATQGIGALTLAFPPSRKALVSAFLSVGLLFMSFPFEFVKMKPAYGLNSTQEATYKTNSPWAKNPSSKMSTTLLLGALNPYPICAFINFYFINCASAKLKVRIAMNKIKGFLIMCYNRILNDLCVWKIGDFSEVENRV